MSSAKDMDRAVEIVTAPSVEQIEGRQFPTFSDTYRTTWWFRHLNLSGIPHALYLEVEKIKATGYITYRQYTFDSMTGHRVSRITAEQTMGWFGMPSKLYEVDGQFIDP